MSDKLFAEHNLIGSYMYLICSRYWRTKVQMMSLTYICFCFFVMILYVMYYKADRLHVAMHLVSNRSQKMPKCGKNINDTPLMADVDFFFYHILM